jgi:hypothetical protein
MTEVAHTQVMAVLSHALATHTAHGGIPTHEVVRAAMERHGLSELDTLRALDFLAQTGRLLERDGAWTLRPQLGRTL